jgi:hypothetical protein
MTVTQTPTNAAQANAAQPGPTAKDKEFELLNCAVKREEEGEGGTVAPLMVSVAFGGVMTIAVLFMLFSLEESPSPVVAAVMGAAGLAFGVAALLSSIWFANAYGNEDLVRDPTWLKEMRLIRRVQAGMSILFLVSIVAAALVYVKKQKAKDDTVMQIVGIYMLVLHLSLLAVVSTMVQKVREYGKSYFDPQSILKPSSKSRNWDVCSMNNQSPDCQTLRYWCDKK